MILIIPLLFTFCSVHGKHLTDPIEEDAIVFDGKHLLFDLNADPTETNIYSSATSESNAVYLNLLERSAYWANYVISAVDVPATTTNKKSAWKKSGGIVSWTVSDNFTAPEIPQKYSYSDAPNIVFVLVDDWGWNDVGYRSTYMNWTTPTIDKLAAEGVKLENYYSAYSCIPARGALLTGRYPIRLGLSESFGQAELPLSEITIGQEMQSAGYRTYMVGKWHMGFSTPDHTPASRGFDSSYSYWNGFVDYWTKGYGDFNDLHDGQELVTDESELSPELHNGYLMQTKAEKAISDHMENYSDQPMFLYYAMQLIHGVWSAPTAYLNRCGIPNTIDDEYLRNITYNYCALNVMLDDAIANLTCALEKYNMSDNTILVLVSDNGGETSVDGNSYPFKGNKGSYFRGGLSATGFIHSKQLPIAARGSAYTGQMHVTDWLPTLMGLATNNEWTGSLFGADLDGVDQWAAITTPGTDSPRSEIVHYHDGYNSSAIQIDMMKLILGDDLKETVNPAYIFQSDLSGEKRAKSCENPSLMNNDGSYYASSVSGESSTDGDSLDESSISDASSVGESDSNTMKKMKKMKNVKSHVSKLTSSDQFGNSQSALFDKSASIIMICILVSLVVLMSVRLTSIMGKGEGDYIPPETDGVNKKERDERVDDERTRLLR